MKKANRYKFKLKFQEKGCFTRKLGPGLALVLEYWAVLGPKGILLQNTVDKKRAIIFVFLILFPNLDSYSKY